MTSTPATRNRYEDATRRFFSLLEQGEIDAWLDLFAADAVHRFPLHSGFLPPEVAGKQEIHEYWKGFPDDFESVAFTVGAIVVDEVSRTAIVLAEAHNVWKGGARYDNTYVFVLRFDEAGPIAELHEYYNPLVSGVAHGLIAVRVRGEKPETSGARWQERGF